MTGLVFARDVNGKPEGLDDIRIAAVRLTRAPVGSGARALHGWLVKTSDPSADALVKAHVGHAGDPIVRTDDSGALQVTAAQTAILAVDGGDPTQSLDAVMPIRNDLPQRHPLRGRRALMTVFSGDDNVVPRPVAIKESDVEIVREVVIR